MDLISEENYIIAQAKKAHETDPFIAKSWIITAKTLYPNNFNVQFEAYKIEKAAKNYEEAAKCFSYIILTFQNQPIELWNEVSELTAALRVPENEINSDQNFYVKMFQHVSYEVQHKILLLTASHSDSNMDHCKLVLLLLKRFPHADKDMIPRLIETLIQGMSSNPIKFKEMLVQEALPLIQYKTPELPPHQVYTIFTIALEYYLNQISDENNDCKITVQEIWKQVFNILELCGTILSWDNFLPYNKTWSKDVYWQKLLQIVSANSRGPENKQVLFYGTTLFIFSLQDYIFNIKQKIDDTDVEYILVEGFREKCELNSKCRKMDNTVDPPTILITPPCNNETSIAFVTAANCWQLLNGTHEELRRDFSQLLLKLPLSLWISRFLFDIAIYFGQHEEAKKLLADMQTKNIGQNLRILSLNLIQGHLNLQGFECILKILLELPTTTGNLLENMSTTSKQRNLILLPLTQRALIQYCTKAIINVMKLKICDTNCSDSIFGDLLVLLQLEYPRESSLAESIFSLIMTKTQFSYLLFANYMVTIDFLEEFMHIWYYQSGGFQLEFISPQNNVSGRRIGTRGADKGVREDFKQFMKQQVTRCNDDIPTIIAQFITQEHMHLLQNIL